MSVSSPAPVNAASLPRVDSSAFALRPLTLGNGVVGTIVQVPTRNPIDFGPMLRGDLGSQVTLGAQLFVPAGDGRFPAVVLVPGSGNIGPHHLEQAAALTSRGIAVLLIDPFYGRGIANTVEDQGRLSWAASTYDVIASARFLRGLPVIDAGRVGAVGSSRGGTAVMMAMTAQISNALLGPLQPINAGVAGYPWCGLQFWSSRLAADSKLLLLAGDKDDWVSVQQCQDAVHALSQTHGDARIKLFPGALHAFDRTGVPPTRIPEAPTSTSFPTVYMDDRGTYLDPRTGKPDPSLTPAQFQKHAIEAGFIRRGVTVGSAGAQAPDYVAEMTKFLARYLLVPTKGTGQ